MIVKSPNQQKRLKRLSVGAGLTLSLLFSINAGQSQEEISRSMLVDMARNQFSVLCQSEVFSSCMGFTTKACVDLSESAITQCLLPLPEKISPDKLKNSSLESCPKEVFANEGFTEEKAAMCFDKAMEANG